MLRLASYDIVFQEIPGEVTLALNISGCPNRCPGCHSPHLQEETGEVLDGELFAGLLRTYGGTVTCLCFMGGDADFREVERLAVAVRTATDGRLKTGWYSGRDALPEDFRIAAFDYIKLGAWVARLGGLDSPTTNQRLYRTGPDGLTDITGSFKKR